MLECLRNNTPRHGYFLRDSFMKSVLNEMKWDGRENKTKQCNVYKMEHWDFQTCEGDLSKWWIRKLSVIRSCTSIMAREIMRRDSYGASDCISKRCSHYRARVESILIFSHAENQAYWSRLMKGHPLQTPSLSLLLSKHHFWRAISSKISIVSPRLPPATTRHWISISHCIAVN